MNRVRVLLHNLFDDTDDQFRSVAIVLTVMGTLAFLSFVVAGVVGVAGA